ncbi:MAG TPA: MFS transporter [Candidatus Limnocylindrales bacterium]|nr:MFS transporter [Candidatus Limnocylindrales bacterium]
MLLVISGCHAMVHAYSTLMPWVYPVALSELHFSVVALGIMVGVSSLAGGFLQLGAGALTRYVRRHTVIGWGAILMGGCGIVTATATTFGQFFLGNLGRSVVSSTQHPLGNSLLSDIYDRSRRGMAIAGHVVGGNLGTVVLTPAGALLVGVWGWRPTVLALTVPAVLAGLVLLLSVRERLAAPRETSAVRDLLVAGRLVLRDRNLAAVFAASLVAAGGRGLGVVILVIPLYLKRDLQLHDPYATGLYTILLVGSVVGPLIGGRLSDRAGRRPVLLLVFAASALSTAVLALSPAAGLLLPLSILAMGLVVYTESPLLQAALADAAPVAQRDAVFSLYFAVAFGVGALWAAGIGALLDRIGYSAVFAIMVLSYLLAGACVLGMREPARGRVRR